MIDSVMSAYMTATSAAAAISAKAAAKSGGVAKGAAAKGTGKGAAAPAERPSNSDADAGFEVPLPPWVLAAGEENPDLFYADPAPDDVIYLEAPINKTAQGQFKLPQSEEPEVR